MTAKLVGVAPCLAVELLARNSDFSLQISQISPTAFEIAFKCLRVVESTAVDRNVDWRRVGDEGRAGRGASDDPDPAFDRQLEFGG